MKVERWGDGLALRLPAAVVDALGLKEGDEVEIRITGGSSFRGTHEPDRTDLLKRLRAFRGRLPPDFKFDRDEANGQ